MKPKLNETAARIRRRVMHYVTRSVNVGMVISSSEVAWHDDIKPLVNEALTEVLAEELPK